MTHIVIIGNGISGITAARQIRKNSKSIQITVVSCETKYFFSRTALMYIFMGHMKFEDTKPYEDDFWIKNNIDLVFNKVEKIDFLNKSLIFENNLTLAYDKLVLAVGSKPNKFGWKGQDLKGVQGLFSYQDLQLMEANSKNTKHAVLVGGGLIGVEMAEMLLSRNIKVTFLVREENFWGNVLPKEESNLIAKHIVNDHHVDLRFQTELQEIISDEDGKVKAIITTNGEVINCQFVGLSVGVQPNIDFLKNTELKVNKGILVNHFLETNIHDVYALGDCAEFVEPIGNRKSIEQVWYTGRMMGEALGKTIVGTPTKYAPGVWFNSAKFFDIEYQTYGWVFPKLNENESTFYWENKTSKMCLRFVFDKNNFKVKGINVFGIRLRHEVCEQWIVQEKTIQFILEHLLDANFDPEFYKKHESEIIKQFNIQYGMTIQLKKKSWKNIFQI